MTRPALPDGSSAAPQSPASQRPSRRPQSVSQRSAGRPDAGCLDGRLGPAAILPLADLLGLGAAVGLTGRVGLPSACYALTVFAILAASGQQRLRICLRAANQAGRILAAAALPLLVFFPWLRAGSAALLALWSAGLIVAFRVAACAAVRAAHRRGLLTEPALIVGAGTLGAYIGELMRMHPELGLRPQGYLDDGLPRRDLALPRLGAPADLADVVARLGIRRVIVCYAACKDQDLVTVLRLCRPLRADVCVVPRLYEIGAAVPHACLDEIWGIPLIPLRRLGPSPVGLRLKRTFDAAVAAILLLASAPVLLVLGIAIRLQSGHAPLFRQARVTGAGRTATVMKLRTLTEQGDPDTAWTASAQKCSALGRWLRRVHLDELPQLVNVLRGEMSLVGPRPERPYFAEQFSREISRYSDRTRMPAGMTGWAQVHGLHGDTSIADRARFDNQYIEYWSPWLDVIILARTLAASIVHRPEAHR